MSSAAIADIQAFAAHHGARPADPLRQPLAEARILALAYQDIWNHPLPPMARTGQYRTEAGTAIRLHVPDSAAPFSPVLVYFHGGGFVLNSVATHERLIRLLANRAGIAVAAIGYSLAPETRFPGQLDEALDAISWLRTNAHPLGLSFSRWAVGGDSAGANLALATTLTLRDRHQVLPDFGLSFYGMFSADLETPSHRAFGGGAFGLTTARVDWFWAQYLADFGQRDNPLAAPLRADLHGLPPQLLIGAGLDCLLDDSRALADRLAAAKAPVTLSVYDGMPHSFAQMSTLLPPADRAISEAAAGLREILVDRRSLAAE
jgi:acetyl esterase